MIVSNATPLINFGKQGVLNILKKCFDKIIIPNAVYNEIIMKRDNPEVIALMKAIEEKWIMIENIGINPILATKNLGEGEKEAISLAVKYKSILLIDDDSAKSYANIFGVETHGSIYIIYLACIKRHLQKEEARKILDSMIKEGFYVSTEVYSRFLELLENI